MFLSELFQIVIADAHHVKINLLMLKLSSIFLKITLIRKLLYGSYWVEQSVKFSLPLSLVYHSAAHVIAEEQHN